MKKYWWMNNIVMFQQLYFLFPLFFLVLFSLSVVFVNLKKLFFSFLPLPSLYIAHLLLSFLFLLLAPLLLAPLLYPLFLLLFDNLFL